MTRKSRKCVPFVFCAAGLLVLLPSGCRKEAPVAEEPAAPGVSTVAERMGDPAYVKKLDAQRDRQKELLSSRAEVLGDLLKMMKERGLAMKGADEAAVRAALEKDPAWQALQKRLEEMNAAIEENRQRTQRIVRERMVQPKNTVSK